MLEKVLKVLIAFVCLSSFGILVIPGAVQIALNEGTDAILTLLLIGVLTIAILMLLGNALGLTVQWVYDREKGRKVCRES